MPAWKLKSSRPDFVAMDDRFVVARDPKGFAVIDAQTGKQLWRRDARIDYSESAEAIAGANIATLRIARGKPPLHELEFDDGQTGAALWKVPLGHVDVHWLHAGSSLVFVVQNTPYDKPTTVTAYALKDGAQAWTASMAMASSRSR